MLGLSGSTEHLDECWGRSRGLVRSMVSWWLVEESQLARLWTQVGVYLKGKVYLKLNTNSSVFPGPVCPLPRNPRVPFTTHLHFFQKGYVCFDPHRFRSGSLFWRTTLRLLQPPQNQDQRVRCSCPSLAPCEDRFWNLPGLQSSLQGDAESTPWILECLVFISSSSFCFPRLARFLGEIFLINHLEVNFCLWVHFWDTSPETLAKVTFISPACEGLIQSGKAWWVALRKRFSGTMRYKPNCKGASAEDNLSFLGVLQGALVVKNPPANAGDTGYIGSIPGLESSLGEENGNPLQYTCLENPMDRGAWWATVHGFAQSLTQLKLLSMHTHFLKVLWCLGYFWPFTSCFTKNIAEFRKLKVPTSFAPGMQERDPRSTDETGPY